MAHDIRLRIGDLEFDAELNDSETARAIHDVLPITGEGSRWGEEFYFGIDVHQGPADDARAEMAVGELAYWPPGNVFCIFFGPTPASLGSEPRAASPVNPVGHITGDCSQLTGVPGSPSIVIEAT